MDANILLQGREIAPTDLNLIKRLQTDHPAWGRTRLSEELCRIWGWRACNGRLKDMACRTLLLKLERYGKIILPARKRRSTNEFRNRRVAQVVHHRDLIKSSVRELLPLQVTAVHPGDNDYALFQCLLSRYHYLGHRNSVGETLRYLLRDNRERPLACVLFGSAAWKIGPRDDFIGWPTMVRERRLPWITNNQRFLILPWVKVPNLASHILSRIVRRIRKDWIEKYNHPVFLLETFVDEERFRGTCYKAANWIFLGKTTGRTRQDRHGTIKASRKDIYVYPLGKRFRQEIQDGPNT